MSSDCVLIEENGQTLAIPSPKNKIKDFKNLSHQIPAPVVVYVSFQALHLAPENNANPDELYYFKPYGFCYYVCYKNPKIPAKFVDYIGEDCMRKFWQEIEQVSNEVYQILNNLQIDNQAMNATEQAYHALLSMCYYCKRKISDESKLKGFSPIDGRFLGAIHEHCEKINKLPNYIPVFVYNFDKFAAIHLLNNYDSSENIQILGKKLTKYTSITKSTKYYEIRMIDVNAFLKQNDQIEVLIQNIPIKKRPITNRILNKSKQSLKFEEIICYFPFDYVNTIGKLSETQLPKIDEFYDILRNRTITDCDYENCVKVWRKFNCRNLNDYLKIYQKFIVVSIVDFFENIRTICMKRYDLDPARNISIPAYAWDAMQLMLHRNGTVHLEYITDIEMYKLLKYSIRGGYSHASKRYACLNNRELNPSFYVPNQPTNFLVHLDANNLSGWAMSQYLPYGDYKWLTQQEIKKIEDDELFDLEETSPYGLILEVDLIYPEHLHDQHNDLPFCCQHDQNNALITQFTNKERYLTHYRNLQQFLRNGLVLDKIHRGICFKQTNWLKPFVKLNMQLRRSSATKFEEKFYKQLNNSLHGKFNRNVDIENDYILLTTNEASNYIDNNYSYYKLNDNFVIVEQPKTLRHYNKLMCIGFTVYDLSKYLMYEYHYQYFLKCGYPIQLLYTNTDSFIYEIQINNFYTDLLKDNERLLSIFDTTGLECWGIPEREHKTLGRMKDESKGRIILEYYGAGSQKYFLVLEGDDVDRSDPRKLTANDYHDCIFNGKPIQKENIDIFEKECTKIVVLYQTKTVLLPSDRKRCIAADKVTTYAKGHYITPFLNENNCDGNAQ